ncbi:hypothetical protein DAI22_11g081900 [Oryza sativa Japonica Group]|nr:hypothetical protein DAI22_11g081900 [Oryza sativa Japonica Group]
MSWKLVIVSHQSELLKWLDLTLCLAKKLFKVQSSFISKDTTIGCTCGFRTSNFFIPRCRMVILVESFTGAMLYL